MNKGLDILKSFNKHIKFINIAVWSDKLFCSIALSYDSMTERHNKDIPNPCLEIFSVWHFHSILHLSRVKSPWLLIIKGYNIKQNGPNLPFLDSTYKQPNWRDCNIKFKTLGL